MLRHDLQKIEHGEDQDERKQSPACALRLQPPRHQFDVHPCWFFLVLRDKAPAARSPPERLTAGSLLKRFCQAGCFLGQGTGESPDFRVDRYSERKVAHFPSFIECRTAFMVSR